MVDPIDVDKLKEEAVSAIDTLFGEDEDETTDIFVQPTSFEEQPLQASPPPDPLPSSEPATGAGSLEVAVNFDTLKEDLLTIDWEYSDERINAFLKNLDELLELYSDKYNQTLLKMIRSVVSYLDKAREKAYPETMTVMPGIIKILQEINSPNFDRQQTAPKVKSAYQEILALRNSISQYNQYVRNEGTPEPQNTPPGSLESLSEKASPASVHFEILNELKRLEKRVALVEAQNIKLKRTIIDMQNTAAAAPAAEPPPSLESENQFTQPSPSPEQDVDASSFKLFEDEDAPVESIFDGEEPEVLTASDLDLSEEPEILTDSDFDLSEEPETLEATEDTPEISLFEDEAIFEESSPDSEEIDGDAILADDLEYDEVESITVGDLVYDATDVEPEETPAQQLETELETELETDLALDSESSDSPTTSIQCCKLDTETIAFAAEDISNIYKLPAKLAKKINETDSVLLKEFSTGIFFSLTKGMHGELSEEANKDLKEMEATVKFLKEDPLDYAYGVLCQCPNEELVVIPVSDIFDKSVSKIEEIKEMKNAFSDQIVNIADQGTVPLIDPCK